MILEALFLRPLRRSPLRFLATLLGISAGVAACVATIAANRAALRALREDTTVLAGAARLEIVSSAGVPASALALLRPVCAQAIVAPVIEELVIEAHSGAVLRLYGIDPLLESGARVLPLPATGEASALRTVHGDGLWVSAPLALELGLSAGSTLTLEAHGRTQAFEVLGVFPLPGGEEAFARTLVCDLALAERVSGRGGALDRIELAPRAGVELAELESAVRAILPKELVLRPSDARAEQTGALVRSLEFNLLALSGISLFVAGVLVATALATSVVQRRSTLALLVSLGAARAQLVRALAVEALSLGAVGGLLGAVGGILAARALVPAMRATLTTVVGMAPESPVRFAADLIWLGLALGLVVATASAILPALEITRTPPLQGLARERPGLLSRRGRVAAVGTAILCVLLALELLRLPAWHDLPIAALGSAMALLAALFAAQAPLCDALARAAAIFPRLLSIAPPLRLSIAALAAGRRRSAWAAGAVGMSVALSVSIATLVRSFRTTVEEWSQTGLRADVQLRPLAPRGGVPLGTLDPEIARICTRLFGAEHVDAYHSAAASFEGRRVLLGGSELAILARRGGVAYRDGRDSRVVLEKAHADRGALVSEAFALRFGKHEGDTIHIETPAGAFEKRIEGVFYDYGDSQGLVIVELAEFLHLYPERGAQWVQLYLDEGADIEAARARVKAELAGRFEVEILTHAELLGKILAVFDRTFAITQALALVSAFVAVIAVLTVLFALLRERAADLALLRSLGASRFELGAQVTLQSGLLGALGAVSGAVAGLVIGLVLVKVVNLQSFGWTLQFHQPWLEIVEVLAAVGVACLCAGLAPAWIASRAGMSVVLREEG